MLEKIQEILVTIILFAVTIGIIGAIYKILTQF